MLLRRFAFIVVPLLLAIVFLGNGCPTPPPVVIDDPVLGNPTSETIVTLKMVIQETRFEDLLRNLQKCQRSQFTLQEVPADPQSKFTIDCHITSIRERGIQADCEVRGKKCTFPILRGETAQTGCKTPSGHDIFFRIEETK